MTTQTEAMKLAQMLDALIQKYSDKLYDGTGAKAANDFELDVAAIRLTFAEQPAQRKPLTADQIRGVYEDCDAPTSGLFTIAFARAIEAAHNIKENT